MKAGRVNAIALSPDGCRIVGGLSDGSLRVWDAMSGDELLSLKAHDGPVNALTLTPDGGLAVSASTDRTVKVWEPESYRRIAVLPLESRDIVVIALTLTGRHLVAATRDSSLFAWDLCRSRGKAIRRGEIYCHGAQVRVLGATTDDWHFVFGGLDGGLNIIEWATYWQCQPLVGHIGPIWSFHPEGSAEAEGFVEGACRHLVKDRMEQAGMRWRIAGAQAILSLRAIYLNGDWDTFHADRIQAEQRRLYPYKTRLDTILDCAA